MLEYSLYILEKYVHDSIGMYGIWCIGYCGNDLKVTKFYSNSRTNVCDFVGS